jgi:hypothetical protein
MSTIIGGSSPSVTFSDSTTQSSAGLTAASPTIASGVLTFPDATTQSSGSGVAKAWGTFNGTGVGTILASYNVSSVTRTASGIYTITFTNALADANYAVCSVGSSGAGTNGNNIQMGTTVTKTSSAFQLNNQVNNVVQDPPSGYPITFAVFR